MEVCVVAGVLLLVILDLSVVAFPVLLLETKCPGIKKHKCEAHPGWLCASLHCYCPSQESLFIFFPSYL